MKAKLFCYHLKSLDNSKKNRFRKDMLGHNDTSHGGRYRYKRKGLLDKIWNKKPTKSVIIVKNKDAKKLYEIFEKYDIKIEVFEVNINL